jgi:hypothetical protein
VRAEADVPGPEVVPLPHGAKLAGGTHDEPARIKDTCYQPQRAHAPEREPASEKRQKENKEEAAGRFQRTPRNIINGGQRLNKNLQLVRNRKMEYSHGRTIGFGFQV